jgi:hypothetical protein
MWTWVLAVVAAWQSFSADPFKTVKSGHIRAFWAADVPEPTWIKDTFAGLGLRSYDGEALGGEVDLWAGAGLDPMKCVPEVIWDSQGKHGARVDHPPRLERGANGGWHAFWAFEAKPSPAPAVLSATAFVFCPIDADHEKPPWGATFTSGDMVIPGPKAKDAYCARKPRDPYKGGMKLASLAGKRTMEVAFSCGVLVRLKGRDLVDECKGDVVLSLDALGANTKAYAEAAGATLSDDELRRFQGRSDECHRITLTGFDTKQQKAFDAAIKRLGERVIYVGSRDGMRQP